MITLSRKKNLTPQKEVILLNEAVQRVNKAKFLGVIVDQHLNWRNHISMISEKNPCHAAQYIEFVTL